HYGLGQPEPLRHVERVARLVVGAEHATGPRVGPPGRDPPGLLLALRPGRVPAAQYPGQGYRDTPRLTAVGHAGHHDYPATTGYREGGGGRGGGGARGRARPRPPPPPP